MPFTPLHLGPGLVLKSALGRHFSLLRFAGAQVVMDIEPLIRLWQGDGQVHGMTHSYLLALPLAALTYWLLGLGWRLLGWLQPYLSGGGWLRQLAINPPSPCCRLCSVLLGTQSHVLLDSIMHADLQPWRPFSEHNAAYGWLSIDELTFGCLVCALLGLMIMLLRAYQRRRHH